MREILFRGKRKDNGEWVYGGVLQTDNWSDISVVNDYDGSMYEPPSCDVDSYEVISETVGQYTGLTDKNGKKIFEGDILKFGDFVYSVEWKEDRLGYGYAERADRMLEQDGGHCTIIGNVHDNPDFLKGE